MGCLTVINKVCCVGKYLVLKYSLKLEKVVLIKQQLTIWWIKMFVNVRNCVTTNATLPGIQDIGIMKLIWDTTTIAAQGR